MDVILESRAVAPLTAAMESAVKLSLEILDNDVMVFPALAPLTDLSGLVIVFRKDVELPSEDILALKGLKCLTYFNPVAPYAHASSSTLTDHDFLQVFEGMSNLKHFAFQVKCGLSINAIITLGIHCRQLRFYQIYGTRTNLLELANIEAPLLPGLEFLDLDGTGTNDGEERYVVRRVFCENYFHFTCMLTLAVAQCRREISIWR